MDDKIRKSIRSFASKVLQQEVHRYGKAGKKAIIQIHKDIIDEWFGEYSSTSMKKSIVADYYSRLFEDSEGKRAGKIYIHAYADPIKYNQNQRIQKWNERNEIGASHDFLVEYVMRLQLFEGIIGLPAQGTRELSPDTPMLYGAGHLDENNRWVNDNFIQQTPLLKYIKSSELWSRWESTVNKHLGKGV